MPFDDTVMPLLLYLDILLCTSLDSKMFDVILYKVYCRQLFCYEGTVPCFYLNISKIFCRIIFQNSSGWLLLKVLQQIKPCSKPEQKKTVKLFWLMLIGYTYK